MAKVIKEQLIKRLASGEFISGEQLGSELGVSRAAISKHVKSLKEFGLDIFRVTGKGYRLAQPLQLLVKKHIVQQLSAQEHHNVVEVHTVIDSTNSYLLRRLPFNLVDGQVCLAEYQTAGRGRRGRTWVSPFGSHLYLSMYVELPQGFAQAMGLSLVVALAIKDAVLTFSEKAIPIQLKWPNDVYIEGKKLAGILTELEGQAMGPSHCVIGIGVNLTMPQNAAQAIEQPWIDLAPYIEQPIDRNSFAACLIGKLNSRIQQHLAKGFESMINEWRQSDLFLDKPVTLITGDNRLDAIYRGVDGQGAALIEINGQIKPMYGGEVSLRGAS